jgi:formylglycine-generating enzyme required for sulfatase activity
MRSWFRISACSVAATVLSVVCVLLSDTPLADTPGADTALGKEQAELQGRVVQALQKGDLVALFTAMDEYRALEKAGATVPAGLYFAEAEAARSLGDPVRAERAYSDYFRVAQSAGDVFNEALRTYGDWKNSIPASAWTILDGMVPVPPPASVGGSGPASAGSKETSLRPFSIGRDEVTRAQFKAFVEATGYGPKGEAPSGFTSSPGVADETACATDAEDWTRAGFEQTDTDPVVCVSWEDARAYIAWLNQSTGLQFRLPTAREWDYAASGGASTRYWFGDVHDPGMGNGPGTGGADHWATGTAPVGKFPANPFGLMDVVGNAAEWVVDCSGGRAANSGKAQPECETPAIRGSSWKAESADSEAGGAARTSPTYRAADLGFRLAMGS